MDRRFNQDIHEDCPLASKTTTELAARCSESVGKNNMAEAYHCALHHLRAAHADITKDNLEFFYQKLPLLADTVSTVGNRVGSTAESEIGELLNPISKGETHIDVRMAILGFKKFTLTHADAYARIGFFNGLAMNIYVTSKGEGCIFSLIDPELCKEHS